MALQIPSDKSRGVEDGLDGRMSEKVALDGVKCKDGRVAEWCWEKDGAVTSQIGLEIANDGNLLLLWLLSQLQHDLEAQACGRCKIDEIGRRIVAKGAGIEG